MRFSFLIPLLLSSLVCAKSKKDAEEKDEVKWSDEDQPTTIFNDKDVPPMNQLTSDSYDKEIKKGIWVVEHFSPWCHHCSNFAPLYQTLYEFYYTSSPVPGTKSKKSFSSYFDIHFARIDCVAFGTTCGDRGISSFPTVIVYKDGEETKKQVGAKTDIKWWSDWLEEVLEEVKPGSRPSDGLKVLPQIGDPSVKPEPKHDASKFKSKDKKKTKANPEGTSVSLTAETFQKQITNTRDSWFIKFYAPWCHHCQAMAPAWASMAREMEGKLNIGQVNCDAESRLCKDAHVKAFPTIQFFKSGERVEYQGLRGLGDLISYAKKAADVDNGVRDISYDDFVEMEEKEEVIFVYFYDHATTSEDFAALDRLPIQLIDKAKIVKTKDPQMMERFKISTWPRLAVSRRTKASYFPALAPYDMRDNGKVLHWMKSVWLPLVPELTTANAREIMNGKFVVLGILNRERSDEFILSKRELEEAAREWMDKQLSIFRHERQELRDAKQLRLEEAEARNDQRALRAAKGIRIDMNEFDRKQVGFAWVDGVFWERWLRTTYGIDSKSGERVIINDEDNRRYWDNTITGHPILPSRTSILETLPKIVANPPKLTPKSTISSFEKFFFNIQQSVTGHPWLTLLVVLLVLALGSLLSRGRMRRARGFGVDTGFFNLDTKEKLLGSLTGSTTNGKVD